MSSQNFNLYSFHLSIGRTYTLAAALKNGEILFLRSYDDVIPQVVVMCQTFQEIEGVFT